MYKNNDNVGCVGLGIILIIIVALNIVLYGGSETTVTITVKDKERVHYGKSSKYLIWTEHEVFENTDSFIFGKFNSSDLYGELEIGQTYCVKVAGWRVPFMSWYRNIIEKCHET